MKNLIIYHNPRCTKSREACTLIDSKGLQVEIIEYLKTPLTEKEIRELLKKLRMNAEEIIRKKEPLFVEKFAKKKYTESEWVKILSKNPILIERPIIVSGKKAIIGRPVENINQLFNKLIK